MSCMKNTLPFPFFLFALGIAVALFMLPGAAKAQVCCKCHPPNDPAKTVCLQAEASALLKANDCSTLPKSTQSESDWTCETTLLSAAFCKPISENGVCAEGPKAASVVLAGETASQAPAPKKPGAAILPVLNVNIPGLQLKTEGGASTLLAQYIAAAYRYGISIVAIVSAIMFIYGAFLYLVFSTAGSVTQGKQIMLDAVIGMMLVLSAQLILRTVNPDLVSLKGLDITEINPRDAFTDAALELARVERYARIGLVEVPVLDIETGEIVAPTAPVSGKPGEVAKDQKGDLIAQGTCPPDMVPIPFSAAYPKGRVESFCMDRYEAPNQQGVKPIRGATEWEAEWYCKERGKRLCNSNEWVRACLGPDGANTYGYGPTFVQGRIKDALKKRPDGLNVGATVSTGKPPAPCNYDTNTPGFFPGYETTFSPFAIKYPTKRNADLSILNPGNPRLSDSVYVTAFEKFKSFLAKYDGSEPSGARPDCKTPEGVYDLTANVSEMTVKDQYANLSADERVALPSQPRAYNWSGFNWSPIPHLANFDAKPVCTFVSGGGHGAGDAWRDYINGFRCCLNLQQ